MSDAKQQAVDFLYKHRDFTRTAAWETVEALVGNGFNITRTDLIQPMIDKAVAQMKAERDAAVEALRAMHHAVCGETGFAQAVRDVSGFAYPWPALDDADELARATLAKIKEGKP